MTTPQIFEDELETGDDMPIGRTTAPSLATLWSRRRVLQTTVGVALAATSSTSLLALSACSKPVTELPPFSFKELERGVDEAIHVAEAMTPIFSSAGATRSMPTHRFLIRQIRPPPRKLASSDTTMIMSVSCPCPLEKHRAITASSASITNIQTRA